MIKTGVTVLMTMLFFVMSYSVAMAAEKSEKLKMNDQAPMFSATNFNGKPLSLASLLDDGSLVLVFLRGFS